METRLLWSLWHVGSRNIWRLCHHVTQQRLCPWTSCLPRKPHWALARWSFQFNWLFSVTPVVRWVVCVGWVCSLTGGLLRWSCVEYDVVGHKSIVKWFCPGKGIFIQAWANPWDEMGAAGGCLQTSGWTGTKMVEGEPQVQWPAQTRCVDAILPSMPDAPKGVFIFLALLWG